MKKIEISWKTILFAVLFPLGLYFIWIIRDLIFSVFLAFIIMSALKPVTLFLTKITKGKISRLFSVFIVFFIFLLVIITVFVIIIPPIISETVRLVSTLPDIMKKIEQSIPNIGDIVNLERSVEYLPNATNQAVQFLGGFLSNTLFLITTFFFSFYFLLEEDVVRKFFLRFFHKDKAFEISRIIELAEKRMSAWFWGELTLMTVVGVFSYIGFSLIGLRFALPLAVLAGILEVVPNIGPVIAAIPAVLIGFSQSYLTAGFTLVLSFIIQQLENTVIVPQIMQRAVGINPIVTLLALLIGGRIGGVMGVLLAIPLFLFIETIVGESLKKNPAFMAKQKK